MDSFIRALINASVSGVRAVADAAMERILWLYNVVVAMGVSVRTGWGWLGGTARYLTSASFRFASKVHGTLWYIIHVRIPAVIAHAVNSVVAWIAEVTNRLRAELTDLIVGVRDWAINRVGEILDFLGRLADWVQRRFNEVWDTLSRAAVLVFTLLTDPRRMAAWVFGALIGHTISYLNDNAESLFEAARDRSTHYAGVIAARIETVLARLL